MSFESGYECRLDIYRSPSGSIHKMRYYKKEIARVAKAIKQTSRKLYEHDLQCMSPQLLQDEKFRKFHKTRSRCAPLQVLRLIDTEGFYVVPMPGDSKETKNRYVTAILGVCFIN